MNLRPFLPLFLAVCALAATGPAAAADPEVKIAIRGHRFVPDEVSIPAGTKVKLVISNEDATPEEFESHELNREKVVPAKGTATLFVGPLKPGRYPFIGEFHKDTAKGVLIAK